MENKGPGPGNIPIGPSIKCPECGYFHPISKDGCPIARTESEFTKTGLSKKEIENFISQARNIILSKGSSISKNQDQFFKLLNKTFYALVDQIIQTL